MCFYLLFYDLLRNFWNLIGVIRLPKALLLCLSMFSLCFLSSTCLLRAFVSMPITRSLVLKIRALRAASADLLLSTAFSMVWSAGKFILGTSSVESGAEGRRYAAMLGISKLNYRTFTFLLSIYKSGSNSHVVRDQHFLKNSSSSYFANNCWLSHKNNAYLLSWSLVGLRL